MYAPHHKMSRQLYLGGIDGATVSAMIRKRILAAGGVVPSQAARERQARERRLAEIERHATEFSTA